MDKQQHPRQWFHYVATPRSQSAPVKIDSILEQRIKAFNKMRKLTQPATEQK